ncbi:hypothetical protein BDF19DRAFT_160804 [Syncephalis fuscata]|nr:hypothetical protein BDF19DRAFT_160804 [Syncephalis fuscata]
MGNNVSSDGGGGRAHSATHTIATTGRISSQPIHRRTHSSSSGRLGRFNLFNSSRGNSSVDLAQTDASMAADMSMRSSSGGRLPPVPGRGLLFSRKMLRRQSDVPLSVSMPLSARDNLDRVTEVVNENGDHGIHSGDDGGPLTRSSTSPRDDPDYSSGFVRQERSHSEGVSSSLVYLNRTISK